MLFALMAVVIHASDFEYGDFRYTIQSDGTVMLDGFKWGYTGSPTSITIPGYVFNSNNQKYYQAKYIGYNAFSSLNYSGLTSVTSLIIQYGVEQIDSYAFNQWTSLSSVRLPSSIKKLGSYVFYKDPITIVCCAAETMPTFTDNLSFSNMGTVSGSRVWNCATPTGKDAANVNSHITTNFNSIGWDHTSADIYNNVMGSSSENNLYNVYYNITEGWDPATTNFGKVKLLGADARASNTNKTLKFSYNQSVSHGLGHYYVTEIDASFRYRASTVSVLDMSATNKVELIDANAFAQCPNLTKVILTAKTVGQEAFMNCYNLTSVQLYDGSDEQYHGVVTIQKSAFANTGVSGIYIPASLTTYGNGAFHSCANLENFNVSSNNSTFVSFAGWLCSKDYTIIYQVGAANTRVGNGGFYSNPKIIKPWAFAGCNKGTGTLSIPFGVTTIGEYAFSNAALTELRIPSSVTTVSYYTFYNLNKLERFYYNRTTPPSSVTFSGIKSGCVLSVPYGCTSTYSSTSPWSSSFTGGINENAYDFAFNDDTGNTTLYCTVKSLGTYSDATVGSSTYMGQVKVVKGKLTSVGGITVDIPLRYFSSNTDNYMVTEIEPQVFSGMTGLYYLRGGEGVKIIGERAFQNCTNLKTFTIPNPVEFNDYVFYGCTYLNSVTLGSRLEKIGASAFQNCTTLSGELSIPATVATIGANAFRNCSSLTGLFLNRTTSTTIGKDFFYQNGNGFKCYVALSQFATIYNMMQLSNWSSSPSTESYKVLPWVKPTTEWTCLSIVRAVTLPTDAEFYIATAYNPWNQTITTQRVTGAVFNSTGMLMKAQVGKVYRFTAGSGTSYSNNLIKAVNNTNSVTIPGYSSTSSTVDYKFNTSNKRFDRINSSTTIPSGGAYLETPMPSTCPTFYYLDMFAPTFTRGDVNGDGSISIADVTSLIDYLLSGNSSGINTSAADCNQDSSISISDVTALIDYLLGGHW